jgi:hypothetical protein
MPGQERHPPATHLPDRHGRRGRAEGGVDRDLVDVLEQGVQAGSPVDADVGAAHELVAAVDEVAEEDDDFAPSPLFAPSPFEPDDVDVEESDDVDDSAGDSDEPEDEAEDLAAVRLSVL